MKITAITCHPVRLDSRSRVLLKVVTDEGIHGWGEVYSTGPDLSALPIADYLFELVRGEDPLRIEYLMLKIHQQFRFPAGGVGLATISAFDHALWDISGKAAGLPVYRLLGGAARDRVRVYHGVGGAGGKETAERARRLQEWGFTAFKTSPYRLDPESRTLGPGVRCGGGLLRGVARAHPVRLGVRIRSARENPGTDPRTATRQRPGAVRSLLLRGTAPTGAHPGLAATSLATPGAAGNRGVPLRSLRVPRSPGRARRRHHSARRVRVRRSARDAQDRGDRRGPLRNGCPA